MHPIHDIDVLVLLATTLASKRRPGSLAEVVAAVDMIHGSIPFESKLAEAFHRLSAQGLIVAADDGLTLTPAAQELVAGHPAKADAPQRLALIREALSAYQPTGEHPAIELTTDVIGAAIQAHKASAQGTGKNLLMPKAKTAERGKRPAPWRRFGDARRPHSK